MSILRVANVQFNASGTRRIDYDSVADDGIIKVSAAAIRLPVGDTASRPNSQAGMIRYNSDTGYVEFGGNTNWIPVASNAAFNVANAAFASANNVAPQVTPAFLTANNAYASINSNWTVTNAIYGIANTSLTTSNYLTYSFPRRGLSVNQGSDSNTYYYLIGTIGNNNGNFHVRGNIGGHDGPAGGTQGAASVVISIFSRVGNIPVQGLINGSIGNQDLQVYKDSGNNVYIYVKSTAYSLIDLQYSDAAGATSYYSPTGSQTTPVSLGYTLTWAAANNQGNSTTSTAIQGTLSASNLGVGNTTPGAAKLHITAANTIGGIGYADFLRVTNNSYPAVTNPVKTFRLNQSGSFEIINNAYTQVIAALDDTGNLVTSGNITSSSRGIAKASMPAGSVLQAASTTKTDTFSTAVNISASGGSYTSTGTTVTGLSVTITPTSSTSKILVMVNLNGMGTPGVAQLYCLLYRDSTLIGNPSPVSARPGVMARTHSENGVIVVGTCSFSHLDSPATTSAVTYSVKVGGENSGTVYVNRSYSDGDSTNGARMSSTITVMEIAQ